MLLLLPQLKRKEVDRVLLETDEIWNLEKVA
jgi:hypothetical protein